MVKNRTQRKAQTKAVPKATSTLAANMAVVPKLFDCAIQHHLAGRLAEAVQVYRRILVMDERHADALHLLGLIARQLGDNDDALKLFKNAISVNGDMQTYHYNLGNTLKHFGGLNAAAIEYSIAIIIRPDYAEAYNNLGGTFLDLGRPSDAVCQYKTATLLKPDYSTAHYNLGAALHDLGHLDIAVTKYNTAILIQPDFAEAHVNLGNALIELGRLDAALSQYNTAIRLKPEYPQAHNNLGNLLRNLGSLCKALTHYKIATLLKPDYAEAYYNTGAASQDLGHLDDIAGRYNIAIRLKPEYPEAHNNLGNALRDLGNPCAALIYYKIATLLKPDYAEAHYNMGAVLQDLGRLDYAVAKYNTAIHIKKDLAEAHNNLGNTLRDQEHHDDAFIQYGIAIRLKADYAKAHNNFGNALKNLGRLYDAANQYKIATLLEPNYAEAHYNLGTVFQDLGRLDAAAEKYNLAIRIKPEFTEANSHLLHCLQHLCAWESIPERQKELLRRILYNGGKIPPFVLLAIDSDGEQQHTVAKQWAIKQRGNIEPSQVRVNRHIGKLRLGYLSADFCNHAVAHLMVELIECHDRLHFDVIGYSYTPNDGSLVRQRLIRGFDRFVDISSLSQRETARLIRQSDIDILIDLTGYTRNARTKILAYRPAPVQVNFLGYPGTMGADFIDYIIADPICIPHGTENFFSEKIVRLPDCYQPNDSSRLISTETPSRENCGLPEHGFIFCCFNNSYKLTKDMFTVWMRLLATVRGSVLWLLEANDSVKENIQREAAKAGIALERLVFAPRQSLPDHLARHRLADLFLDTLPYNAHTTASDALWAGLPVLTCLGKTFAGRVAASLLSAAGLEELITSSLAEYEALAVELATHPIRMTRLKEKLATNRRIMPLFNSDRFARNIEAAYRRMWELHNSGRPPEAFDVSAMRQ